MFLCPLESCCYFGSKFAQTKEQHLNAILSFNHPGRTMWGEDRKSRLFFSVEKWHHRSKHGRSSISKMQCIFFKFIDECACKYKLQIYFIFNCNISREKMKFWPSKLYHDEWVEWLCMHKDFIYIRSNSI